jgi:hypothetical protein
MRKRQPTSALIAEFGSKNVIGVCQSVFDVLGQFITSFKRLEGARLAGACQVELSS